MLDKNRTRNGKCDKYRPKYLRSRAERSACQIILAVPALGCRFAHSEPRYSVFLTSPVTNDCSKIQEMLLVATVDVDNTIRLWPKTRTIVFIFSKSRSSGWFFPFSGIHCCYTKVYCSHEFNGFARWVSFRSCNFRY